MPRIHPAPGRLGGTQRSAHVAGDYENDELGEPTMKKSGNSQWLRAGILTATLIAAGAPSGQYAVAQTSSAASVPAKTSELDEIVVTGTTVAQKIMETS